MIQKPKVSFVICTLNCKDYTERCIKSIREQDYPQDKVEIIVVDSYSEDGTIEVAESLGAKVILTKVKGYMEGKGMPKSIGCENATGDIIITIDSDNALVEKDWIMKMIYPLINDSTIDYTICQMAVVDSDPLVNQYLSLVGTDPFAIYNSLDPQISLGKAKLIDKGNYWVYNNTIDNFLINGGYYVAYKKETLRNMGGYIRDVDNAYNLASKEGGANIAIAKNAHLHHLITKGYIDFMKKKIKWGRYYFNNKEKMQGGERKMQWAQGTFGKLQFVFHVLYGLILIPAFITSIKMLAKTKEKAWILHAPLIFSTTVAYIWAFIKRK
jgi:glycosyltransferase involved in cell wall biosynthesis